MGCASSSDRGASASKTSAFDRQLIDAVRRHGASRPRVKSLDQILLRLPAVRDMVESLRVEFAKAHTTGSAKGDQIALADFAASAEALHLKLPDETLKDVLAAADVDGDHMISFKEFSVLLVLCWLLRPESATEGSVSGLDPALNTLCDAFLYFDVDGRGSITRQNVEQALGGSGERSGSHRGEANAHAPQHAPSLAGGGNASRRRFSEMDFDHNGRVSFPEFVAALESWAGVEEEE